MIYIKNLLIIPAFIAIVALGIWGTGNVVAADSGVNTLSIVTRIAQRFGLSETDVQKVFEEHRQERHEEHAKIFEERLTQAVTDGKITEQQKQAILGKFKELHEQHTATMESFKDMTPQERRTAMEKKRIELESWAKEQGIDTTYLFGIGMGMRGKPAGRVGMHGFEKGFGMKF